ncbi:MAG: DNA-deoxyinosine glycosylase, partial [Coriobacteriales bacterium]|jgi:hypoxanthine-DNA glycosylase
MLLENRIALWDVIASCDIIESSDSSIRNAVPNDVPRIVNASGIDAVIANGRTAEKLYARYLEKEVGIGAVGLPSTSPANAAWSLDALIKRWGETLLPLLG